MTESRSLKLKFESNIDSVEAAELIIRSMAAEAGYCQEEIDHISLAVRESMINAVMHGNEYSREKFVHFSVVADPSGLNIRIQDEGEGFDPDTLPDPTAPENLLKASGRGLLLIRAFFDEVVVRRAESVGMEVIMLKHRPKGDCDKEE